MKCAAVSQRWSQSYHLGAEWLGISICEVSKVEKKPGSTGFNAEPVMKQNALSLKLTKTKLPLLYTLGAGTFPCGVANAGGGMKHTKATSNR